MTVRLGDLPKSSSWLAAYVGPQAPETAMQEAEAMAATARVLPYDPALVPPPPPGSRPGFDQGGVDAAPEDLMPVASVTAAGVTYTVRALPTCAVVAPSFSVAGSALSAPTATENTGIGTSTAPSSAAADARSAVLVEVVAVGSARGLPALTTPSGPGSAVPSPTMVVLARVGPGGARVTGVLVDGGTVDGAVGDDGWAVLVTDVAYVPAGGQGRRRHGRRPGARHLSNLRLAESRTSFPVVKALELAREGGILNSSVRLFGLLTLAASAGACAHSPCST